MLLVDSNEPDNIVKLLQQSCPVTVANLNLASMSDFWFSNYEGKRLQFGRVQANELLGDIDSMEDELRRYYSNADENFQIIEGIISGEPLATFTDKQIYAVRGGKIAWRELRYEPKVRMPDSPTTRTSPRTLSYTYKVDIIVDRESVSLGVITGGRGHNIPISLVDVWIHRLAAVGVYTYRTINWQGTARMLGTIYRNEQKPPEQHSTLQRVVRPRIHIKEADPFMKSLLFLSNAYQLGIGEKKARALADRFVCILDIATASVAELVEVEGIGRKMAEKILSSLGRDI